MDARVDFAVRSVLNLAGPPLPLGHQHWEVLESLGRVLRRYPAPPVEFYGICSSVPDVLFIPARPTPGAPAYCVYTERHYCMVATLKTLSALQLTTEQSRMGMAHNVFLRLAADYFLQQGAHGDAARLYCASWLSPAGDEGLAVDAGLFDTLFTNPVVESALVDGGWPLAHELGHIIADSDEEVPALLADLLNQYLRERFGGQPPVWGPPGARDRLIAEVSADWFGAELLLRSIAGRTLGENGLSILLNEFAGNMSVMMLMESCKEMVRLACTDPSALGRPQKSGHRGWMYDVRRDMLFHSIRLDLWEAFPDEPAQATFVGLIRRAMAFYRLNFDAMLAGLSRAERTLRYGLAPPGLDEPLLQELNPRAADWWDTVFRPLASERAQQSRWFGWATREFVNRARATHNSHQQSAELIGYLDRLAPDEVPPPARHRLKPGQRDWSGILPPEYLPRR
ncbi:hypothetical protein [Micromonospora sp. CPCC 205558]|uniref:hypothetical protein n=1 Tax=Micromonospora sp. CPCC 205558 TaxID=3122403 RepID=UPI002FF380C0